MRALLNSKKGQQMPKTLNFILGLIMVAVGGLALFGGMIGISLPKIPQLVLTILVAVGGLVLLLDGFMGVGMTTQIMPKSINRMVGGLVFLAGLGLLLIQFNVLPAINVPTLVMNIILLLGGIVMLFDGILGAQNF